MTDLYQQAISEHRQRVYSFVRYSLRSHEDAEDVTQDVFIKLWRNWRGIDHSKLGAWVMRVAHNAVIDHVRKTRVNRSSLDEHREVDELGCEHDSGAQLDQEACKRELMQAITELDDPFRSIVIMRDIQGMAYAEIETSLGLSESQVKVYLHRSRRKLRDNHRLRQLFAARNGEVGEAPAPASVGSRPQRPDARNRSESAG